MCTYDGVQIPLILTKYHFILLKIQNDCHLIWVVTWGWEPLVYYNWLVNVYSKVGNIIKKNSR